ncbi:MAG: Chemotaxis protein methyltransferase CheR, partial [Acidobacteria bacterium]|nr:Chemotaxis protein methyltransferase CheR [Acidobacteriota bacterium]
LAVLTRRTAAEEVDAQRRVAPVAAKAAAIRVLVVDDNQDGARMLADALDTRGYQTRVAHDGPEALAIAARFDPSIAFLDIGLPVMDGYELAARLRELPALRDIRLIAITGYGQPADRRKARASGFHDLLVKPVDFDAIDRAVATVDRV